MALVRTNVTLPEEVLRLVDEVAGPRGRSRYIAEVVGKQVRRDNARMVFEKYAGRSRIRPGRNRRRRPPASEVRSRERPDLGGSGAFLNTTVLIDHSKARHGAVELVVSLFSGPNRS
jgi:hypothetical protein